MSCISFSGIAQTVKHIRDKLCPGFTKTWYQAGTSATNPGLGDVKCAISKRDQKFKFYKFMENYSWKKLLDVPWKVIENAENIGKVSLMIGKNTASYFSKKDGSKVYLHLKLKKWEYVRVFF